MSITTMSDEELLALASVRRRADEVEKYDFNSHGFSAATMATYLAHETLQLRAQLRSARERLHFFAGEEARREIRAIDDLLGMWAEGTVLQPALLPKVELKLTRKRRAK